MQHELKTSYRDFREYLEEKYLDILIEFEHLYNIAQVDLKDPRISEVSKKKWSDFIDETLWREFEYKIGMPDIVGMINLSDCLLGDMDLDGGLINIEDTMDEYWKEQYGYMSMFQQYVQEWIEKIDTSKVKPRCNRIVDSSDYFLNFNYTDTLENVYKIEDVLHIHGGVKSVTDIAPIMGHCNKKDIDEHIELAKLADEELDEGNASIHRAIAWYLSSVYKDTTEMISYNTHFWRALNRVDHVVIIGWSAGDTDLPYLRKIRENVDKKTVWDVYCYNDKAFNMLKHAMIVEKIENVFKVNYIPSSEFWD